MIDSSISHALRGMIVTHGRFHGLELYAMTEDHRELIDMIRVVIITESRVRIRDDRVNKLKDLEYDGTIIYNR